MQLTMKKILKISKFRRENQEAADKAVSAMNKKEVDGRTINVEISRPRSDVPKARRGKFDFF